MRGFDCILINNSGILFGGFVPSRSVKHSRLIKSIGAIHRRVKAKPSLALETTPNVLHKEIESALLGSAGRMKLGNSTFAELMFSLQVSRTDVRNLLIKKFGSKERVRFFLTNLIERGFADYDQKVIRSMAERISKKEGLPVDEVKHYLDHHLGNSRMPLSDKLYGLRASLGE